jgi:hypothetical protein
MAPGRTSLQSLAVLLLSVAAVSPAAAQLASGGFGAAFRAGDFKSAYDLGTGFALSGRLHLPLAPFLQWQPELGYARWSGDGAELTMLRPGANLALHGIRLGSSRPYLLAGVFFARERLTGTAVDDDTAWRFGTQVGAGADFRAGPVSPFAELRWVSPDAPGSLRYTHVLVLIGLKVL